MINLLSRRGNLRPESNPRRSTPLSIAVALALNTPMVIAAEQNLNFNIPAQALGSALNAYADVANVQLSYPAELTNGLRSSGVSGALTAQQALQRLLVGTGLGAKVTANGSITLEKVSNSQVVEELGTINVTAKPDENDPANPVYSVKKSSTATKTDTPIFDTPASIQVVPKAVMDDQNTTRIKDALENVSGVRAQPSLGFGNGFLVRGFRTDRVYRNGLAANSRLFGSEFDTANLESVEVLKGPAAVLFGRSEPGGLINITTKKPLDVPFYSLEQQFGSYDLYRTEWDATGPLNNDKSVLYRFTGSYQNNNSFRDLISNDRVTVSPSITWKLSDATDFTLNVEGLDQDYQADFGIPVIGSKPAPISIRNSFGDPNDPIDHISKVHLGTEFNHKFNQNWAIHNRFLMSRTDTETTFFNPAPAFGTALRADNRTLDRNIFSQTDSAESYTTNLDLTGKFQLGFSKHETLVGFDYTETYTSYKTSGLWDTANPDLAIDIFNPRASYGVSPTLIAETLTFNDISLFKDQWYGAYFQDHITLWDKLHIMGGGRYDWAEVGRGRGANLDQASNALHNSNPTKIRKDEGFSPRVGILYQPWNWLGVYGNWTTSFGANNGVTAEGAAIAPEIGEQFEAGFKTALFDDRLSTTLAYYHLTKNNLMTADLSTPDLFDNIAIGEARSQGIEFDMTGRISNNLSLIGSYAYTDARVTKNNDGFVGEKLTNVPEHSGSLWLKYDFNGYQALDGLSIGLGGVAADTREGNYSYYGSPFQLPGYVRADTYAAYKFYVNKTKVTAQINIRNLLDKRYYESTDPDSNVSPQNGVYPGTPLMAVGSVKVEF